MTEPGPRFAVAFPFLLVHVGIASALSFLYLSTQSDDWTSFVGNVGLCFSGFLAVTGLITLSIQLRNETLRRDAQLAYDAIHALLPVSIAVFAWPVTYLTLFLACLPAMACVILACMIWTCQIFSQATEGYCHFLRIGPARWLRWVLLLLMTTIILGSWIIFVIVLDYLESQGYKVGWS